MEPVGFVGLGRMGAAMAKNLVDAGAPVRAYNRTPTKAAALGLVAAGTPGGTVAPGGIAISMVADDAALEAVCFGPGGLVDSLGAGGVHLSMSTVSPALVQRLAEAHAAKGAALVAGPVFGRPEAAAARKLFVVLAGPAAAKARVAPVVRALGQGSFDFGEDPAAAATVKLCGNFLLASAIEAMAEAFTLGEKAGVDPKALAAMLGSTLFACPVYQNYGAQIAERRFTPPGFALPLGLKDVELALAAARAQHTPLPLGSLLRDRFLTELANGHGERDWAGIADGVRRDAGLG